MAIRPNEVYPAQTVTDAGYPYGMARNDVTLNDGTGTPLEQTWLRDLFGFQQALLVHAGIEPNDIPDSSVVSQYVDAIRRITGTQTALANWRAMDVQSGLPSDQVLRGYAWRDESVGIAIGQQSIHRTTDGGETWEEVETTAGSLVLIDCLHDGDRFCILARGVASTQARVMQSVDGEDWEGGLAVTNWSIDEDSEPTSFAHIDGMYAIGHEDGAIRTAPSGTTDATSTQRTTAPNSISKIAAGQLDGEPGFVAVCASAAGSGGWYTGHTDSPDTWDQLTATGLDGLGWADIAYSPARDLWIGLPSTSTSIRQLVGADTVTNVGFSLMTPHSITMVDDGAVMVLAGSDGGDSVVRFGHPVGFSGVVKLPVPADGLHLQWNGRRFLGRDTTNRFLVSHCRFPV